MPARKEKEKFAKAAVKDCWHPYGLQGLAPEKFAHITTLILDGKHILLGVRYAKTTGVAVTVQ